LTCYCWTSVTLELCHIY